MGSRAVELRGVHLEVDGRAYLRWVDLALDEGQTAVIAGLPGCGKSFVLRLLLGLPGMDRERVRVEGQVLVDGAEVLHVGAAELQRLRRRVGAVLRDGGLIENMDIRSNICLPLNYHYREALGAAEIESRCQAVMADFDLGRLRWRGLRPVSLNRQERLYASLARALVMEPHLLLLDDPAAGLSPWPAYRLCRFAFSYVPAFTTDLPDRGQAPRQLTRLATAADLGPYLEFADRFILLSEGRLLQIGDAVAVEDSADPRVRQLLGRRTRPAEPSGTEAVAAHG